MAITATITKQLDAGYAQVDATHKSGYTRYYKLPKQNAGKFAIELENQDKNLNLYSNIVFFTSIFAGVLGASFFTKKMESRIKQFLIQTSSAIILASLSSFGFNKYTISEEQNLKQKYKAKEIFYRA